MSNDCGYYIGTDGQLYFWGDGDQYQHGKGTADASDVDDFLLSPTQPNKNWKQICVGNSSALALAADGTIWTVGRDPNNYGLHGQGSTGETLTSWTQVGTGIDWDFIYLTDNTVLAIKSDGNCYAWGYNSVGQCGISPAGTHINQPTLCDGVNGGFDKVAQADNHSYAIRNGGEFWFCGFDNPTTTPIAVWTQYDNTITDYIDISAREAGCLLIRANRDLYCFGTNAGLRFTNLLGGTGAYFDPPTDIPDSNAVNVLSASCSIDYSFFVTTSGAAYGAGSNSQYQLGTGSTATASTYTNTALTGGPWLSCATINDSSFVTNGNGQFYAAGTRVNFETGPTIGSSFGNNTTHLLANATLQSGVETFMWLVRDVPSGVDRSADLLDSPTQILWQCTITGAPDSTADYILPINSFSYRAVLNTSVTLQLQAPLTDDAHSAILARPNGELVVELIRDAVVTEIARAALADVQREITPSSRLMTLSGVAPWPELLPSNFTVPAISHKRIDLIGSESWRMPPHPEIMPGDSLTADGRTMTVSTAQLGVSINQAVTEITGSVDTQP